MITRYVNTASSAGGDGTTNATSGASRAYASLMEALTTIGSSPVSDDLEILCCGASADGKGHLNDAVLTTSESYTATIAANPNDPNGKHPGYWSDQHYRIEVSGGTSTPLYIKPSQKRIIIVDGIQVKSSSDSYTVHFYGISSGILDGSVCRNCLVDIYGNAVTGIAHRHNTGSGCSLRIENCVVSSTDGANVALHANDGYVTKIYNCLVYGTYNGLTNDNSDIELVNCAVSSQNDDFEAHNGGSNSIDHCASNDGDGTNPVSVSNWDDQFINPNYNTDVDYRIADGADLKNAGVGPSANSNIPVLDILGNRRSGSVCNVGPFEKNTLLKANAIWFGADF